MMPMAAEKRVRVLQLSMFAAVADRRAMPMLNMPEQSSPPRLRRLPTTNYYYYLAHFPPLTLISVPCSVLHCERCLQEIETVMW